MRPNGSHQSPMFRHLHACFSIGVGYKLRAAAELCLEIMVQDDIEYRYCRYGFDVSVPLYWGTCDFLNLYPDNANKNAGSLYLVIV